MKNLLILGMMLNVLALAIAPIKDINQLAVIAGILLQGFMYLGIILEEKL